MILLCAVLIGFILALARAGLGRRALQPPPLRLVWLVPLAYLPQALVFQIPATSEALPEWLVPIFLVGSQSLLLLFVWRNIRQPGFAFLGLGLLLNLLVITLNGGLMPISPETVAQVLPNAPADSWEVGQRIGRTKDVLLPVAATRLAILSDRFLSPSWLPSRVAFSMGDVFAAWGAIWLLWSMGGSAEPRSTQEPVSPVRSVSL